MTQSTINREQIISKIAVSTGLTKTKVRPVLIAFENQIAKDLKAKAKVKLTEFGTLYLLDRKSRTIKQVKSGKSRLLLERTVIKFKSSLKLKAKLVGKTLAKRTYDLGQGALSTPKKTNQKTGIGVPQPEASALPKTKDLKPKTKIVFPPLRMMPTVDRQRIQKLIKEKLSSLTLRKKNSTQSIDLPTATNMHQNASGKVFLNLIKQAVFQGSKSLSFSIDKNDKVAIYSGRPRKFIAQIEKDLVTSFLKTNCEIDSYDLVAQRFVKISKASRIVDSSGLLDVHVLPTRDGASVYIKIQ